MAKPNQAQVEVKVNQDQDDQAETPKGRGVIKITGIAAGRHDNHGAVVVLCDDLTVWTHSQDTDSAEGWTQFPPIPQA